LVGEVLLPWQILYGLPGGGFSAAVDFPELNPALTEIAVGDVNGDGLADIVSTTTANSEVLVLISLGDGGFESASYDIGYQDGPSVALVPRRKGPPDILFGELDVGVGILPNTGDGSFGAAHVYATPGGQGFVIGDFNGDCLPDIATPSYSQVASCQSGWPIAILYGAEDRGFSGPQLVSQASKQPEGIAVLGPVDQPRAFAIGDGCGGPLTVYGDASKH
jgi:hypothetical protein